MESRFEVTEGEQIRELRVVTIPLLGREWAALRVPYPLTEEQWARLLATLDVMKPGIVTSSQ